MWEVWEVWEVWEDGEEVLPPHTPHTPHTPLPTLCVRNPGHVTSPSPLPFFMQYEVAQTKLQRDVK